MLTKEELQAISDANDIQVTVDNLLALQDNLLKPVVVNSLSNREKLKEVFSMLPFGFYKTEIRQILDNTDTAADKWAER